MNLMELLFKKRSTGDSTIKKSVLSWWSGGTGPFVKRVKDGDRQRAVDTPENMFSRTHEE